MRRTKTEAQKTKECIFTAGVKVFSEKGYASATLADVAREAGITRGAIYWHFKNKEAFFGEIIARVESFYDDMIERLSRQNKPFLEIVHDSMRELLSRFNEDSEWKRMQELVIRTYLSHGEVHPSMQKKKHKDKRPLELIKQAMGRGEMYRQWDAETALTALGAFTGGMVLMLIQQRLSLTETQIEDFADFAVRGFSPYYDTPRKGEE
jgi:TetR/AcrR family acrAB operon transcriptional repressor